MEMWKFKIKNKKLFVALVVAYIIGFAYFCIIGEIINPVLVSDNLPLYIAVLQSDMPVGVVDLSVNWYEWLIISLFLIPAILWQTDLSGPKLNRIGLAGIGMNALLTCLSRGVVELILGEEGWLSTILTIIIFLVFLVSGTVGICYLWQKKNGKPITYQNFSDIMTEEEFERWQERFERWQERRRK